MAEGSIVGGMDAQAAIRRQFVLKNSIRGVLFWATQVQVRGGLGYLGGR
jgi:hypothetical protein